MANEKTVQGCVQGDPPKGASSEGIVKGLGGGTPAKPKKAKKDKDEDETGSE